MEYGCIGKKLTHSFSKEIHSRIFDYDYRLFELSPQELPEFMKRRDFKAVNVTIPYKQAVIPYLDYIDPAAAEIGAVNTVINRNGKLYGYNTDFFGLVSLLKRNGINPEGKKVLIAGSGGTSKTAVAVAKAMKAAEYYRISRSGESGCISYEEAYTKHSDAEIIINTTPCGMFPQLDGMAIDISAFRKLCGVADAVYNPLRSELVEATIERGVPAAGGLYMLVAQAVTAAELFTGQAVAKNTADSIYTELKKQKENIVLIGMPGCGKTTVGLQISEKCGMDFFDTDAEIIKAAGISPGEIILKYGEKEFRDIEQKVIASLAVVQGAVIATGGGAVLRKENIFKLRQNGKIFFLDRPPEKLAVTADRPLSNDTEKLYRLYKERYPLYNAYGKRIDCSEDNPRTISNIIKGTAKK